MRRNKKSPKKTSNSSEQTANEILSGTHLWKDEAPVVSMFDPQCVFCLIAQKKAPASVIYKDEQVIAFMDIRPVSEGHALIIPKLHCIDLFDTPNDLLAKMHIVTKRIAAATKKATKADGISIVQQNGSAAGQDIFHIHVHVIPRFEGKKMPRFEQADSVARETLDAAAEKIRQNL